VPAGCACGCIISRRGGVLRRPRPFGGGPQALPAGAAPFAGRAFRGAPASSSFLPTCCVWRGRSGRAAAAFRCAGSAADARADQDRRPRDRGGRQASPFRIFSEISRAAVRRPADVLHGRGKTVSIATVNRASAGAAREGGAPSTDFVGEPVSAESSSPARASAGAGTGQSTPSREDSSGRLVAVAKARE